MIPKWTLRFTRNAIAPRTLFWRKKDKTPIDLTAKTIQLRIKPRGSSEIVLTTPDIQAADAVNGKIVIEPTPQTVADWNFSDAEVALQIGSQIIQRGVLEYKNWYE